MLRSCPGCGAYVRALDASCPHCGAVAAPAARSSAAILLGLTLAGCTTGAQALYGAAETGFVDADGDGWTLRDGDCDDADETVHPEAEETVGDGVDSNCDGEDDT